MAHLRDDGLEFDEIKSLIGVTPKAKDCKPVQLIGWEFDPKLGFQLHLPAKVWTRNYAESFDSGVPDPWLVRAVGLKPIGIWQKGRLLGSGSFASVYEVITEDGSFFAAKEVSLLDEGSHGMRRVVQLENEIALLSQLEHKNIVRYIGTEKGESNLYIFLEFVSNGSLLSLYRRCELKDSQVSTYTRQILHGLVYLHDRSVVHRDIKCANILVEANGSVKVADFGLAKIVELNDVKSCQGTVFWMAPEVVNGQVKGYGLPADIWSLGCTVLEMLTGKTPYSPMEWMSALFRIGNGELPPVPDSLSSDARDFIMQCLAVNPDDRPTAVQLLDHKFVQMPYSRSYGDEQEIDKLNSLVEVSNCKLHICKPLIKSGSNRSS